MYRYRGVVVEFPLHTVSPCSCAITAHAPSLCSDQIEPATLGTRLSCNEPICNWGTEPASVPTREAQRERVKVHQCAPRFMDMYCWSYRAYTVPHSGHSNNSPHQRGT